MQKRKFTFLLLLVGLLQPSTKISSIISQKKKQCNTLTSTQRRELDQLYWRHRHLRERGPTWDLARRLVELQDVFLKNRERIYRESSKKGDTNIASSVDIKSSKSTGLNLRRRRRRK